MCAAKVGNCEVLRCSEIDACGAPPEFRSHAAAARTAHVGIAAAGVTRVDETVLGAHLAFAEIVTVRVLLGAFRLALP